MHLQNIVILQFDKESQLHVQTKKKYKVKIRETYYTWENKIFTFSDNMCTHISLVIYIYNCIRWCVYNIYKLFKYFTFLINFAIINGKYMY